MRILLGSKNPSKRKSLEKALETLNIVDYEILSFNVESGVSSKPIGYEMIRGTENRNKALKKYAIENNIQYDYLCSIEGGFSCDENGLPFVVTNCIVEDYHGKKSTGKSLGLRLSATMFDFISNGGSLNQIIEKLTDESDNKQKQGITGYLTNQLFQREIVDKDAIISSFISFVYSEQREKVDDAILRKKM